ncbi:MULTISPECIES: TetR/AcrR family transcriptional regulator [unclassified Arthrobacter]|uniref:TetR/AcrR family transcriptional regulator n=1 Tax=unclassified Arthrobacter TaxID=235627 RepID=UPI001D14B8A4|nr:MULTISPECIES: TetR/AcrR family transcriptional regulator [unclassified Arthrobacter]MCC3275673.1 TetR/AcrR family transcriptional regulator [Arthrobacter sp. zg-Y20]MCC9177276.1 TetR/AcrR family transcriptional regulator [Arthrobacter sp. zg-Y750]MDK1315830.1 TetR/AcrR family transcriptional regulator [Arthrobacter sp. zg.Y20]WIB06383.1 TetR/AcrR family transcriptional regulator [Arthrobacter sp. zg-Y20]
MTATKQLRADARRNRDALIAAARHVFDAGDVELRFDDFARLAGVGTGTLYRHFPTREALAEAVYQEEIDSLCERAGELQDAMPAEEALEAFLHGMVDHMESQKGLGATLAVLLSGSTTAIADGTRKLTSAVDTLVTAAAAAGTIRKDIGAGAVLLALHGIGTAYGQPGWRHDADGMITLLMDGMRTTGSGRS